MSDLMEHLRRIPADLVYFDSEGSHETHNIGAIAKRAADEIDMLSESEIAAREGVNAWRAKCMDAEARITELEAENARAKSLLRMIYQVGYFQREIDAFMARAALAGQGDGK